jgi:hypothetical protein
MIPQVRIISLPRSTEFEVYGQFNLIDGRLDAVLQCSPAEVPSAIRLIVDRVIHEHDVPPGFHLSLQSIDINRACQVQVSLPDGPSSQATVPVLTPMDLFVTFSFLVRYGPPPAQPIPEHWDLSCGAIPSRINWVERDPLPPGTVVTFVHQGRERRASVDPNGRTLTLIEP